MFLEEAYQRFDEKSFQLEENMRCNKIIASSLVQTWNILEAS